MWTRTQGEETTIQLFKIFNLLNWSDVTLLSSCDVTFLSSYTDHLLPSTPLHLPYKWSRETIIALLILFYLRTFLWMLTAMMLLSFRWVAGSAGWTSTWTWKRQDPIAPYVTSLHSILLAIISFHLYFIYSFHYIEIVIYMIRNARNLNYLVYCCQIHDVLAILGIFCLQDLTASPPCHHEPCSKV